MAYFLGKGIDANLDDLFPRAGSKAQCLERCKEQLALNPAFDYAGCLEGCGGMRVQPGETTTLGGTTTAGAITEPVVTEPTAGTDWISKMIDHLLGGRDVTTPGVIEDIPTIPISWPKPGPPEIPPEDIPIIPPIWPPTEPVIPPVEPPFPFPPTPKPPPKPPEEPPAEPPIEEPPEEPPEEEKPSPTGYIDKLIEAMFGRGFERVRGIGGRTRESVFDMLAREGLLGTGAARGVAGDIAWQTERGISDLMRGTEEMKYMHEQDTMNMLLQWLFSMTGAWG